MKNFLHHLFVPRPSNNHRPKILHQEVLMLIVAFLMSGYFTIAGVEKQYPAVLGDATSIAVEDLLNYTNMQRKAKGLAPLKLNSQLSKAADEKAHNMFANNYWAHIAPDGTTPWVFIKDSGYQYLYAGENLARGYNNGSEVVDAWMNSPSHRENMLSPNYTDIGFAVLSGNLTGSDTVLVVQMFGSPFVAKEDAKKEEIAVVPSGIAPSAAAPAVDVSPASQSPTIIPSPTETVVAAGSSGQPNVYAGVAAIQSQPLVDTGTVKRNTSFIFLLFFIFVLVFDAVVVERKNIVRAFTHNLDHILFLAFILLAGIIIGKGAIL